VSTWETVAVATTTAAAGALVTPGVMEGKFKLVEDCVAEVDSVGVDP
jgi:hypothetical protein